MAATKRKGKKEREREREKNSVVMWAPAPGTVQRPINPLVIGVCHRLVFAV